jgi:hypothetical protein
VTPVGDDVWRLAVDSASLKLLLHYDPTTGVFTWRVKRKKVFAGDVAGSIEANGYIRIGINGTRYLAHRIAWFYVHGEWPAGDVDHKDTIKTNNRIENLRPATRLQNQANKRKGKNNTSGFKGVSIEPATGKWRARIREGGRMINLGTFSTLEEAGNAYRDAAIALHGDYARA